MVRNFLSIMIRIYGQPPYTVAVIHGGPGAGGEMAPVARELSVLSGILEPIQSAASIQGQLEELENQIKNQGQIPITLVGYSWGAWLSYLFAAQKPQWVNKLILVSSGPFEEQYTSQLLKTRFERLGRTEKAEFNQIITILNQPDSHEKNEKLARLGALAATADNYDLISEPDHDTNSPALNPLSAAVYQSVWESAAALRRSGELLNMGRLIRCPVTAIHGDYDPHPACGVREPLSRTIQNFKFILLTRCGHTPWLEKHGRAPFYQALKGELAEQAP